MYNDVVRVLSAIHGFDYTVDLSNYGSPRPNTFVVNYRHGPLRLVIACISIFSQMTCFVQYKASKIGDDTVIEDLAAFLEIHLPQQSAASGCCLIHGSDHCRPRRNLLHNFGDFRIDNCIFHPTEDRYIECF